MLNLIGLGFDKSGLTAIPAVLKRYGIKFKGI